MEDQTVLIIFSIITIPWLAWLSLTVIQNRVKVSTLFQNDATFEKEMKDLLKHVETSTGEMRAEFKEMRAEVRGDIEGLSHRLDLFIQQEINTLKEIGKHGK